MRLIYFPLQLVVSHPLYPVQIGQVLPAAIDKVIGIKAVHSAGAEQMLQAASVPVIGHLSLELNNLRDHFGTIDVACDHRPEADDGFWQTDIVLQRSSLLSGTYENKIGTGPDYLKPDGSPSALWHAYMITIYLKAYADD